MCCLQLVHFRVPELFCKHGSLGPDMLCPFILVWGQNCRKGSGVCGPVSYRLSHRQPMHLGAQSAWDQSVVGRNPPLPFCRLICRFLSSYANPSPALSLRASLSDTFLQKDVVNQCLEFDLLCQWNQGQYQQWSVLAGCPLIFHLAGLPHV